MWLSWVQSLPSSLQFWLSPYSCNLSYYASDTAPHGFHNPYQAHPAPYIAPHCERLRTSRTQRVGSQPD